MALKTLQVFSILLALWLGFSYLEYAQKSQANTIKNGSLSPYNLLHSSSSDSIQKMRLVAQEQDKVLDYMVWPKERSKLIEQAIELAQKQLSQRPYKPSFWERFLYLQYEKSSDYSHLPWVLENMYRLAGWNDKAHVRMARYCIPFAFRQNVSAPNVCVKIINTLPFQQKQNHLARTIGISPDDLKTVLSYFSNARSN